jgi:leucyl-tRNA synthetase
MEMFGEDFEKYDPEATAAQATPVEKAPPVKNADPSKAQKGKLVGKATGLTYQFQIMESIGESIGYLKS